MEKNLESYPAQLSIEYPEKSDRFTVFFRIFMAIPILIVFALLMGTDHDPNSSVHVQYVGTAGVLFLPAMLMILFRRKYPRWWYDWNLQFTRFANRIGAYLLLLRDEYPSTDEEQAVHINFDYPDAETDLHQFLPLVKWFLAIPHLIILAILWAVVIICTIIAWFVILFTGSYPRGLFDFVVGVLRWTLRVDAYAFLLVTDVYPTFSLQE